MKVKAQSNTGLILAVFLFLFMVIVGLQYLGSPWDKCHEGGKANMVNSDPSKAGENDLSSRLAYSALDSAVPKFEASIKSCLGSGCFDEHFKSNDGKMKHGVYRMGFLSPDLYGMDNLLELIRLAGQKAHLENGRELVADTHVPAYGYGKNHGWSRIIRFVTKVPEHAVVLLERQGAPGASLDKDKYSRQIKQLMRWHCRLNHVAAHTSMLSIFVEDFIERPTVEMYKILSFLGIRPSQVDIEAALEQMGAESIKKLSENFSGTIPEHLVSTAADALRESTARMHKWPCDSFQQLEVDGAPALPIPASALAPDCKHEAVTCSVPVDLRGG